MALRNTLQVALLLQSALALAMPEYHNLKTGPIFLNKEWEDAQVMKSPWIESDCFDPSKVAEGVPYTGCPKTYKQHEALKCPMPKKEDRKKDECSAYCEQHVSWNYGKEVPFEHTRCGPGSHCPLVDGASVQVAEPVNVDAKSTFVRVFNSGSTFKWTDKDKTSRAFDLEKPKERHDNCGYWTFVPQMITSCGIVVTGKRMLLVNTCFNPKYRYKCRTSVFQTEWGIAGGEAVFVAVSCRDRNKRLGFCKQDPIYLKFGVSIDPEVHEKYVQAWKGKDETSGLKEEAVEKCEKDQW